MPVAEAHGPGHTIVRRAKCARGAVTFDVVCAPRFDYGRTQHSVEAHPGEVIFTSRDRDRTALRLRAEVPCVVADGAARARFTLRAGQTAAFVLEAGRSGRHQEIGVTRLRVVQLRRHGELLAHVGRPVELRRPLAGVGARRAPGGTCDSVTTPAASMDDRTWWVESGKPVSIVLIVPGRVVESVTWSWRRSRYR